MKLIAPLLAGKWKKYKANEAREVAAAMIEAARENKEGPTVYIQGLLKSAGLLIAGQKIDLMRRLPFTKKMPKMYLEENS
jgi:hypothetical protein